LHQAAADKIQQLNELFAMSRPLMNRKGVALKTGKMICYRTEPLGVMLH